MEALQINPQRVFAEGDQLKPYFGIQLRLMYEVGLRPQEAVMFRPRIADKGDWLIVSYGTKGGKSRTVPIRTPAQREIVEQAKVIADANPKGYLGPSTASLKTAMSRFYKNTAKIGLTKKGMGVTAYGMRHSFANVEYETITGVPSPVMGGPKLPPEERRKGQQGVARATGHERPDANGAYNSTNRTQDKLRDWRCQDMLGWFKAPEVRDVLGDAGLKRLLALGPEAEGERLGNVVLFAYDAGPTQLSPENQTKVREAITAAIHRACLLFHVGDPQAQGFATLEVF